MFPGIQQRLVKAKIKFPAIKMGLHAVTTPSYNVMVLWNEAVEENTPEAFHYIITVPAVFGLITITVRSLQPAGS